MRAAIRKAVAPAAVLSAFTAYFAYLAASALHAGFAVDDPMNLGLYWTRGFLRSLWDYRPAGAMFYLPIYYAFGLNPTPYRLAIFVMLGVNIYLTFRLVNSLVRSNPAAALAAVLVCAHGNMAAIYFNTSQVYDILAYLFSVSVLLCYVTFRKDGRSLTIGQWATILAIYVAALGSKEVAVPVAAWILAYELLFHRPWRLAAPLVLLMMAAASAAGKLIGADSLSKQQGYLIEITWHRYFVNNRHYLNDLLYTSAFDSSRKLVLFWCVLLLICCLVRRRELWWSCFVAITAMLPLSFTVQPRGGPALYLPWLGWALLASVLVGAIPNRFHFRSIAAGLVGVCMAFQTIHSWRYAEPAFLDEHRPTMSVIAELRSLPSRPGHNSRVIFLGNPLNNWAVYFIAALLWNDPTIDIQLADRMTPAPTQSAVEQADWILDFKGDKLIVLKADHRPFLNGGK